MSGRNEGDRCVLVSHALMADLERKRANGRGQRAQAVVGVVLDDDRTSGQPIRQQGRVGDAQPRIAVERAHAGDDRVEIGKGGSALAGSRIGQHGVADGRHAIAGLAETGGDFIARPGNVADSGSPAFQREGYQLHVGVGQHGLDGNVVVLDAGLPQREAAPTDLGNQMQDASGDRLVVDWGGRLNVEEDLFLVALGRQLKGRAGRHHRPANGDLGTQVA